jgi:hypothetical protein
VLDASLSRRDPRCQEHESAPEISVPNTNTESRTCTGGGGCGTWSEGYTTGLTDAGYAEFHVTPDSVTIEAKGTSGVSRHSLTVVNS